MLAKSRNSIGFEAFEMHRAAKVGVAQHKLIASHTELELLFAARAWRNTGISERCVVHDLGKQVSDSKGLTAKEAIGWGHFDSADRASE